MQEEKNKLLNQYKEIIGESFHKFSSLDGFLEFIESVSFYYLSNTIEKFKTFPCYSDIDYKIVESQVMLLLSKNIFNEKAKKFLVKNDYVDAAYYKLKDFLLKKEKYEELQKLITFHENKENCIKDNDK